MPTHFEPCPTLKDTSAQFRPPAVRRRRRRPLSGRVSPLTPTRTITRADRTDRVNDGCCLGTNDTRRKSQQRPERSVGADCLLSCPSLSALIKRSGAFNPNMSSHNNNTRASETAGLDMMCCEECFGNE